MIVEYLRLGRIHTAPATVILLVSSYCAGGGRLFSLEGFSILLYGILLHWSTFGHNVVCDYWFDIEDPNKKHHPLVSGRISLQKAVNIVLPVLGLALLAGILLSYGNWLSNAFFASFMIGGFLYNNWLSKTSIFGWIPIVVCFTSLSLYGMSLAGSINIVYALYMMFTIWFQIGWSGYLKDIEAMGQANMLRRLGSSIRDGVFRSTYASKVWGASIKVGNLVTGAILISRLSFWASLAPSVMLALAMVMLYLLVKDREWVRDRELRNMSLMEIFTIYAGMFMVMDVSESMVLALFGLSWFAAMNRLLWKTSLAPRV